MPEAPLLDVHEVLAALEEGPCLITQDRRLTELFTLRDLSLVINESKARLNLYLDDEEWLDVGLKELRAGLDFGATLQIQNVLTWSSGLIRFALELQRIFKEDPIDANLYMTPVDARPAFAIHHDPFDFFVLQLYGRKHWEIYKPQEPFPVQSRTLTPYSAAPPELLSQFELVPGDVLFVRRGDPHRVRPVSAEPSLHVNFRVQRLTGETVLLRLVQRALSEAFLRSPWPPAPDESAHSARIDWMRQIKKRFTDQLDEIAAIELIDDAAAERASKTAWLRNMSETELANAGKGLALSEDSLVTISDQAKPWLLPLNADSTPSFLSLSDGQTALLMRIHSANGAVTLGRAGESAGLLREDYLVIANKLIQAGLLTILEA